MSSGSTVAVWVSVVAVVIALVALVVAARVAARGHGGRRPGAPHGRLGRKPEPKQLTADESSRAISELETDAATALRHVAVVRYDAFGDMGGHLSWSVALLDDRGDGLVLTSIHGRSDSRTYAKNVTEWESSQQLSPEEQEAIRFARTAR